LHDALPIFPEEPPLHEHHSDLLQWRCPHRARGLYPAAGPGSAGTRWNAGRHATGHRAQRQPCLSFPAGTDPRVSGRPHHYIHPHRRRLNAMSWKIADRELDSRFLLGTAAYPSPQIMLDAVRASGAQVVTVGLKRQSAAGACGGQLFFSMLRDLGCHLLPNTAGCSTAAEAVALARMAREIFDTSWIKLEVIGDEHTLQPDVFELVAAAGTLAREGFQVFPYCTDDLVVCRRLLDAGCVALMPWAAPIGSGQGLINPPALRTLRERLPDAPLIVDAGIG